MPRITLRQQLAECIAHSEGLQQACDSLRADNITLGKQKSSLTQANTDLKTNKDRLLDQLDRANDQIKNEIKARDKAKEELRLKANLAHDLTCELSEKERCLGFRESQNQSMQTLLYNSFTLLWPHLVARRSDENTDLLEPNDRLLLQLLDILNQGYPPMSSLSDADYVRELRMSRGY